MIATGVLYEEVIVFTTSFLQLAYHASLNRDKQMQPKRRVTGRVRK